MMYLAPFEAGKLVVLGGELQSASDLDLGTLWTAFRKGHAVTTSLNTDFLRYLRGMTREPEAISEISFCHRCGIPGWDDSMITIGGATGDGECVCETCASDHYYNCAYCGNLYLEDSLTTTGNGECVCETCASDHYSSCGNCEDMYLSLTETGDGECVCQDCLENHNTWCENCSEYYNNAGDHDHHEDSDCCESPQQDFTIRNDGAEPLASGKRTTIELPAGIIDTEGLNNIRNYLTYASLPPMLTCELETLGNQWQTRTGNYAKRLSALAYKRHGIKLTPEIMSQVGVIAREHSKQVSVTIDITRNLNMDPGEFYNDDSCWWESYSASRCALKTNGGFGLRTVRGSYGEVRGRAWVMPLRQDERGQLIPTFETMTPDALAVFNGYGDLSGYAAARIIAQMAGWTYRKINFYCSPMYINADACYLVTCEEIATRYTSGELDLSLEQHSDLFIKEQIAKAAAAAARETDVSA